MDIELLPIIQQSINLKGVGLAILLTQIVKYWMPSPQPFRTTEVVQGTIYGRILPFLPVVFGVLYCAFVEPVSPWKQDIVRGVFTGMAAAYGYRAGKVAVFGG